MEYYYNLFFKKEFSFGRRSLRPLTGNAKKLLKLEGYPSLDKICFRSKKVMEKNRYYLYLSFLKYYVRNTLPNKFNGGVI